jgi:hypothetical protein
VIAITYLDNPYWHRIQGMILFMLFAIFIFTALYSAQVKLSPLGNHVIFMEWVLGLSIAGFMCGGLISIVLAYVNQKNGKPDHEYFQNHKMFMMATIMGSGGPGIFRVLRTLREIYSGRLWYPSKHTEYAQINYTFWRRERGLEDLSDADRKISSENIKDFRDVESSYFCYAFIVTSGLMYIPYYWAGFGTHWIPIFVCTEPILGVAMSVIMGKIWKDYHFDWRLDYNFRTLKFDPKNPNFEA